MAVTARPAPVSQSREEEDDRRYPTRDGKPMGETDKHRDQIMYCIEALRGHYTGRPEVYVSGDNFIFYEQGNPKARVSPDCYVVFGAGMRQRDSYMAWREGGRLPAVVFEITSRKTRKEDVISKFALYEQVLRVPEYFLFDPKNEYLKPRLQGYRLVGGRYMALGVVDDRLRSEQLGLDLVLAGDVLRFFDPARGALLPTPLESARRAEAEARRAEAEAAARAAAEAEVARLRARLAALERPGEAE